MSRETPATDPIPAPCVVDPHGHARAVLEFEALLEAVVPGTRTAGGAAWVRARVPEVESPSIAAALDRVQAWRRLWAAGGGRWPLERVADLRPVLAELRRPDACLDGVALRQVADVLACAEAVQDDLREHDEVAGELVAWAADLEPMPELRRRLESRLLPDGEIDERAAPQLRRLRAAQAQGRQDLLDRLAAHLGDRRRADADGWITLRGDRYVIPVPASDAGRVEGIVHDRSGTGNTWFVEPLDVVGANNALQALREQEAREIRRLLAAWTAEVAAHVDGLQRSIERLEALDGLQAIGRFADRLDAQVPQVGPELRLVEARHPLLWLREEAHGGRVVPLNADLGTSRALVLSGPNTGGKTVALKTLGLLVLMRQAGIPIPAAAETRMPVYRRVVADVGDEQSIAAAQSTFSSHLLRVVEALEVAAPGTLVLLDEFMAGTDPEDGAALGEAVLDRLVVRGATTWVTTHLGGLKRYAHAAPGVVNAAMRFDEARRVPLFELEPGVPGRSNALAVAEGLGLDAEVLEHARQVRGETAGRLEELLRALETERQRLETLRHEAAAAAAAAASEREAAEELRRELERHRRAHLREARTEAERLLQETRARVEAMVRELRHGRAAPEAVRAAHDTLADLRAKLEAVGHASERPRETLRAPQPGDEVWVRSLERPGRLEELLGSGRAHVRFGNVRLQVTLEDLEVRSGAAPESASPPERGGTRVDTSAGEAPAALEIDLRGMDRETACQAIDAFLDRAVLQGVMEVRIIHGKGTGALRRGVSEHLARHPQVVAIRLGEHSEGGSGVTIARLA